MAPFIRRSPAIESIRQSCTIRTTHAKNLYFEGVRKTSRLPNQKNEYRNKLLSLHRCVSTFFSSFIQMKKNTIILTQRESVIGLWIHCDNTRLDISLHPRLVNEDSIVICIFGILAKRTLIYYFCLEDIITIIITSRLNHKKKLFTQDVLFELLLSILYCSIRNALWVVSLLKLWMSAFKSLQIRIKVKCWAKIR